MSFDVTTAFIDEFKANFAVGLVLTPTEATAKLADTEKALKVLMKEYQGKSGLNKDAKYIELQKERKTLFAQKNPA